MVVKITMEPGGKMNFSSLTKNWKTTATGIATAFFSFVLYAPQHFQQWPWLITLSQFAAFGGVAAFGIAAKDSTTHSTSAEVAKSTSDVRVAAAVESVSEAASIDEQIAKLEAKKRVLDTTPKT